MIAVVTSVLFGLVSLGAAAGAQLLAATGRGKVGEWLKVQHWVPRLVLSLTLSGSAFLSGGFAGNLVRWPVRLLDRLVADLVGAQEALLLVSFALGITAAYFAVFGLIFSEASTRTVVGALLLPLLLYAIPGPVGEVLGRGITLLATGVGYGITWCFEL